MILYLHNKRNALFNYTIKVVTKVANDLARNVQAIIPGETHRVLRDVAYTKEYKGASTLKELICAILVDFADKVKGEAQLKRTLNAP
jgi:hypothetical protein